MTVPIVSVLRTVKAWNGQLPPSSVCGILRGDEACSVVWNYGPARFAQFGDLRGMPYREIAALLREFIAHGYLRQGAVRGRHKLWLTEAGEKMLAELEAP